MKKKILLFGANGGTGHYFVKYFLETYIGTDYELVAIGTKDKFVLDNINIPYYKVDITNKNSLDVLPKDVYAVIHLAGIMPARMEGYYPQKYIDVNITGTLNILEWCKENHVDRILYAQSFGDIKDIAERTLILKPNMDRCFKYDTDHTIYVMSKNFAVDLIKNYQAMYGLKGFVFRLPTIYLYSKNDFYYVDGVKRKLGYRVLIDKAINGEPIEVWGDPNRKKDMVYVKDFCQMLYKALFVNRDSGYYNVGTGIGTSLLDQVKGMVDVFSPKDKKSDIIFAPDKPNAPQYIMDIENAKIELGYEPKYSYIEMLKDIKKEMGL